MKLDDLITKLKELKDKHGNLKVILWTQKDAWSYDEHDIAEVYLDEDPDEVSMIVIQGRDKTQSEDERQETDTGDWKLFGIEE